LFAHPIPRVGGPFARLSHFGNLDRQSDTFLVSVLPRRPRLDVMNGSLVKTAARALDAVSEKVASEDKSPAHLVTGRVGEEAAYFYLRKLGYVMVARNWRVSQCKGELDLVAWDGDVLCFVEVKTRTTRDVKPAEAAVDEHKRRELALVARHFLRRLRRDDPPAHRFDVVSVYSTVSAPAEITLFKNAFPVP
jgi:putative endonuclease